MRTKLESLQDLARWPNEFASIDGEDGVSVEDAILYWDALLPSARETVKPLVEEHLTRALAPRGTGIPSRAPLEIIARSFPTEHRTYDSGDITTMRLGHNVAAPKVDAFLAHLVSFDDYDAARRVATLNGGDATLATLEDARQVSLGNAYDLWLAVKARGDRTATETLAAKLVAQASASTQDADALRFGVRDVDGLARALREISAELQTPELAFAAARASVLCAAPSSVDLANARQYPELAEAADFAEARVTPWRSHGELDELRLSDQQDKGYDALVQAERALERRVDMWCASLTKMQRQNVANALARTWQHSLLAVEVHDEDKVDDTYWYSDDHAVSWPSATPAMRSQDRLPSPNDWPSAIELASVLKTRMREELGRFITFIRDDADEGHIEIRELTMRLHVPSFPATPL